MHKTTQMLLVICLLAAATTVMASPPEHYLHVKVEDSTKGESVNVNVPLSMAEKILPTVNRGNLHDGRVMISDADLHGVDFRALLDAVRSAPDNEFVSVKQRGQDVRVAKSNGSLVVHVREIGSSEGQRVDITVPMNVVDALFSTVKKDELDVAAALRALDQSGEALLVTVQDATQHVRIWVDSHNASE